MAGSNNPPNRVYESMTKVRTPKWTFRVWRQEDKFTMGPDPAVVYCVQEVTRLYQDNPEKIVQTIETTLPRINDIEILNNEGDGACVYPDWP